MNRQKSPFVSIAVMFAFLCTTSLPMAAFAEPPKAGPAITVDAPVTVDVKVPRTVLKPNIVVNVPEAATPVFSPNVQVNPTPIEFKPTYVAPSVIVQPAPVVVQQDQWYKNPWVWVGIGVLVTGATVGGVCGAGHCGGGSHTSVNFN